MPLDIPAVPSATQAIRVARAAYDVVRDGGAVGAHVIPGQQVPSGALITGFAFLAVDTFVSALGGGLDIWVKALVTNDPINPVSNPAVAAWYINTSQPTIDASYPVSVVVVDQELTAGSAYIWVFYLIP